MLVHIWLPINVSIFSVVVLHFELYLFIYLVTNLDLKDYLRMLKPKLETSLSRAKQNKPITRLQ